jgi:hypothetical protein
MSAFWSFGIQKANLKTGLTLRTKVVLKETSFHKTRATLQTKKAWNFFQAF